MNDLDEIDSILHSNGLLQNNEQEDEIDAILSEYESPAQKAISQESSFDLSRFIGEQMAKGALSAYELLSYLGRGNVGGGASAGDFTSPLPEELQGELNLPGYIKETVNPTTPTQRMIGSAARGAGSIAAVPIGGLANIAKSAILGGGISAGGQGLQELGVPAPVASGIEFATALGAPSLLRKGIKPNLSSREQKVASSLKEKIGEENVPSILERLKRHESKIGYAPTTAELAESPAISQLHQAYEGVPGSGISEKMGKGNSKILEALAEESGLPMRGEEFNSKLKDELIKRESIRHNKTNHMYRELEKMEERLNPKHLKEFIKNEPVTKRLKKELKWIRDEISPKNNISNRKEKLQYPVSNYLKEHNPEIAKHLDSKRSNIPTVGKLSILQRDINDALRGYRKEGFKTRHRLMKDAKKALSKDLESIPLQKEADALYHQLSGPVSEITEFPVLQSALKDQKKHLGKSSKSLKEKIFDKNSEENVSAIKNVFKDDKETLEGLRKLGIHHFMSSIKNSGQGGEALSYDKMTRFMTNHGKAFDDLLSPSQKSLVFEVEKILKGQNKARTLGSSTGSPTFSRKKIDEDLTKNFEKAENLMPFKHGKKFLNWWKNRSESAHKDILYKFLLETSYAEKLLSQEFKTQGQFNNFMNGIARQSLARISQKEEGEEDK